MNALKQAKLAEATEEYVEEPSDSEEDREM